MGVTQSLFFVFFIYGLAFFGMGVAMAIEAGRPSAIAQTRVLLPLAAFGLIHGTHEWMESYFLQADSLGVSLPDWLPWLKLGFLITSFLSLLLFAYQALRLVTLPLKRRHRIMLACLVGYLIFILISADLTYQNIQVPWVVVADGMGRYMLAVPASIMAAMGLRFLSEQSRRTSQPLRNNLNIAAISFGLYALTQMFVHPISMFPASVMNDESFLVFTGIPIQVVRSVVAVTATISLLRATRVSGEIQQRELFAAKTAQIKALEERNSLRRELLRHIVRAQEDERSRIARELHDETAQTLSAFALELATLRNEKLRKPEMRRTAERLQELSHDMSQGLYRLVGDLRPAQLDDLGLVPALRFLIEQECTPIGLHLDLNIKGIQRRLDPLVETVLFRVAQEALANMARHAHVQEGRVNIVYGKNDIFLQVSDAGCGFDPTENFHPPHGWGLAGMKERVESVDGTLHVDSAPNLGTSIEVRVPLDKKETT